MTAGGRTPLLADPRVRRIAIVRLRVGLGDLLASVPALRALRRARPDAFVSVVTWPEVGEVLARQSGYVDDLLPFPGHPGIPERPAERAQWRAFVDQARARDFDVALQMYGWQPSANVVTARVPARLTGGFFSPGLVDADPATHLPYPAALHEVHRHLALLRHLGVDATDDTLEFPLHARDAERAAGLRRRHRLDGRPYACLHPGATAASRRWPVERFAAVGDALARLGLAVVVTGVATEAHITAAVASAMRQPSVDLAGETDLGSFAALLAGAHVLVANDTGAAHLAHALRVPSVTVFMSGELQRWAAFDRATHVPLQAGVECQPCAYQQCPIDLRCAEVSTARVAAAASRLVSRIGASA